MRKILDMQTGTETSAPDSGEKLSLEVIAAEAKQAAINELNALDIASVRALREYVAAQPDAPQIIKDRENAAKLARAKL